MSSGGADASLCSAVCHPPPRVLSRTMRSRRVGRPPAARASPPLLLGRGTDRERTHRRRRRRGRGEERRRRVAARRGRDRDVDVRGVQRPLIRLHPRHSLVAVPHLRLRAGGLLEGVGVPAAAAAAREALAEAAAGADGLSSVLVQLELQPAEVGLVVLGPDQLQETPRDPVRVPVREQLRAFLVVRKARRRLKEFKQQHRARVKQPAEFFFDVHRLLPLRGERGLYASG